MRSSALLNFQASFLIFIIQSANCGEGQVQSRCIPLRGSAQNVHVLLLLLPQQSVIIHTVIPVYKGRQMLVFS